VHLLGKVFVENETKDVVPKFVRAHLPTKGIGDVPEAGLESLFVVLGHEVKMGSWEIEEGNWIVDGNLDRGKEEVLKWED